MHATDITENPEDVAKQPESSRCSSDGALSIVVEAPRVFINSSTRCRCTSVDLGRIEGSLNGWTQKVYSSASLTPADVFIATVHPRSNRRQLTATSTCRCVSLSRYTYNVSVFALDRPRKLIRYLHNLHTLLLRCDDAPAILSLISLRLATT